MLLLFSAASEVDLNSTRWTLSRTGWFWFALLFSSWQPRLDNSWYFFLATILNLSWCRHTSSWTQRSFTSQMATLWKSCSRYKRILLTSYRRKVIATNTGYVGPLLRYEKQQRERGRQRSKFNWSHLFWEQCKGQNTILLSFLFCSNITFSITRAGYDHWSIFSELWGIFRLANLRYWVQAGRVETD